MATMTTPTTARPPITPPTMAPTGGEAAELLEGSAEVLVLLAELVELVVEDDDVEGLRLVVEVSGVELAAAEVRVRIGGASSRVPMETLGD